MKRFVRVAALCLLVFIIGCSARFRGSNRDLYSEKKPFSVHLQELKTAAVKAEKNGEKLSCDQAIEKVGIRPRTLCAPWHWERVKDSLLGKNTQVQVPLDQSENWIRQQREWQVCSVVYEEVFEKIRPDFSWGGLVGKKTTRHGPSKEIAVACHGNDFFDAGGFGPDDVNQTETEWLWSILGRLTEGVIGASTSSGAGEATKKVIKGF